MSDVMTTRIVLSVAEWLVEVVKDWEDERGIKRFDIREGRDPNFRYDETDDNQYTIRGEIAAFSEFVDAKTFKTNWWEFEDDDDDDYDSIYGYRDYQHARIIINNELHNFGVPGFDYIEPWDDTNDGIDWMGCYYLGKE